MNAPIKKLDYGLKHVLDDLGAPGSAFRKDTELGIFARQLTIATFRELFMHEHTAIKWLNDGLMPINTSISAGATEFSYVEQETVGRAKIIADDATDLPLATIEGRNNILPIKTVGIAIKYSRQEVRTAQMQGMFDIVSSKVMAAREGHDRTLNDYIRSGVPGTGIVGILDAPGILTGNAITGDWTNPATTPDQILADMRVAINTMINNSGGVEVPNTVVMPVAQYTTLKSRRMNPGFNETSILDALMDLFPEITRWDWEPGMATAGPGGTASLVVYRNEASRLRAVAPLMMAPIAPEPRGLSFILGFETRWGGLMVPRPRSVFRLDGI